MLTMVSRRNGRRQSEKEWRYGAARQPKQTVPEIPKYGTPKNFGARRLQAPNPKVRPPAFRGVPGPASPLLEAPLPQFHRHLEALGAVGSGQGNLAPGPRTGDWVTGFLRGSYRLSLRKLPPPRNPAGCSSTRCTLPNGVCRKKASVGNTPYTAPRRKAAGR